MEKSFLIDETADAIEQRQAFCQYVFENFDCTREYVYFVIARETEKLGGFGYSVESAIIEAIKRCNNWLNDNPFLPIKIN